MAVAIVDQSKIEAISNLTTTSVTEHVTTVPRTPATMPFRYWPDRQASSTTPIHVPYPPLTHTPLSPHLQPCRQVEFRCDGWVRAAQLPKRELDLQFTVIPTRLGLAGVLPKSTDLGEEVRVCVFGRGYVRMCVGYTVLCE